MASKEKTVDAKALMGAIAKGYKLVDTPKVRAGFKKGQQKLVQADGKTLGLLTIRDKGVRVDGSRLPRSLTVSDAKDVTQARSLLEAVNKENLAKLAERANRQTAVTAKRVAALLHERQDRTADGQPTRLAANLTRWPQTPRSAREGGRQGRA